MLQLPKFPIKCKSKDGESFAAFFKHTGNPKLIKIVLKTRSESIVVQVPTPSGDIQAWAPIAVRAFSTAFPTPSPKEETNVPPYARPKNFPKDCMPLSEQVPATKADSKPKDSNPLLSKVRSSKNGTDSKPTKNPSVIFVRDAHPAELYVTAQTPDPKKQYICRTAGKLPSGEYTLSVYFPHLREWTNVNVKETYLLRVHTKSNSKENAMLEETKAIIPKPNPAAPNAPQARSPKGLTVYEAWGKAFTEHATKPNAPELIVKFMQDQYPGRKTLWAKWVNPVRARYNAGKLPNTAPPIMKIATYRFETHAPVPTRSDEDRRQTERRTPPLKAVRKKTPPAPAKPVAIKAKIGYKKRK